jgi:hypothetical protein
MRMRIATASARITRHPGQQAEMPGSHLSRDGQMRFGGIRRATDAYYEPNSFNGPVEVPGTKEPPLRISGDADRYNHRDGNDDYGQVTALFNLFDAGQKERLFSNIAAAMGGVPGAIIERQLGHFKRSIRTTKPVFARRLKEAHGYEGGYDQRPTGCSGVNLPSETDQIGVYRPGLVELSPVDKIQAFPFTPHEGPHVISAKRAGLGHCRSAKKGWGTT